MTTPVQDFAKFYDGNGATTAFPYTWKVPEASHLRVVTRDDDQAAEVLQVLNVGYTVDGVGTGGGNVNFAVAPVNGAIVAILLYPPLAQEVSVHNGVNFFPRAIEDALDRLSRQVMRQAQELKRCIKVPETEDVTEGNLTLPPAALRAEKAIGFDVNGAAMALQAIPEGSLAASAFGENWVAAANADSAMTLLGFSTFFKTLVDDASAAALRGTIAVNYAEVSPGSLGSNQNDYAGWNSGDQFVVARVTTSGVINFTGVTGGADGKWLMVLNVGSNTFNLPDEDTGSSAANRFANLADVTNSIAAGKLSLYRYSGSTSRWVQVI
jgi:hypothetical protein